MRDGRPGFRCAHPGYELVIQAEPFSFLVHSL
jgi:hypothetical protein